MRVKEKIEVVRTVKRRMLLDKEENRGITLIALVVTIVLNSCRCGRKEICII